MPKLLVFTPCEKILIDQKGNASLIVLLHSLSVPVPFGQTVPANAVAPTEWGIFSMWRSQSEEVGKKFKQQTELLYPDGNLFKHAELEFVATTPVNQNNITIRGFPIGQQGSYSLHMWLEENSKRITEDVIYPISVKYMVSDEITQTETGVAG